jgi:asparagine synthase (glutamine-hydrolysing)
MCGITGIINLNQTESKISPILNDMTSALNHRGPDDEGFLLVSKDNLNHFGGDKTQSIKNRQSVPSYFPSENIKAAADKSYFMGLGFRRLSIIDLSPNGHQPMSYLNRYWIIFNGEIYNYIELKNELESKGYYFNSKSDTEAILAAYDCWGVDCLNKFNGMWSFCIYDTKEKSILIARDRYGIKPLVYYFDNDVFLFASEIKALLKFKFLKTAPNSNFINEFLIRDTREYLRESSFENIFNFPTGSFLKIRIADLTKASFIPQKYYKLTPNLEVEKFEADRALHYSREYFELLNDAVNLRLRADVPIGTCFSGGLDSSAIVHLMNNLLKGSGKRDNQKAFSIVFKNPDTNYCDESKFIENVTKKLEIPSFQVEPNTTDVRDMYPQMIYCMENPQVTSLMSYMFTYKLVKDNGVIVTLDGQGADEQQAGYIHYLRNYFSNLEWREIVGEMKLYDDIPGARFQSRLGIMFHFIQKLGLHNIFEFILNKNNKFTNPFINLNQRLHDSLNGDLITLFHFGDRAAMWNSVESRFPMMDYRVVEFWSNLSYNYKIHLGWTKYIARLAYQNKLPDEITWRRDKIGWETPQITWFSGDLKNWLIDNIRGSDFVKQFGIDYSKNEMDKVLNHDPKNREKIKKYVKSNNLALWHRTFFNQ